MGVWGFGVMGLAVAPTQGVTCHTVISDGLRSIVSITPQGVCILDMIFKHSGSGSVSQWESLGGKPPRIDASAHVRSFSLK